MSSPPQSYVKVDVTDAVLVDRVPINLSLVAKSSRHIIGVPPSSFVRYLEHGEAVHVAAAAILNAYHEELHVRVAVRLLSTFLPSGDEKPSTCSRAKIYEGVTRIARFEYEVNAACNFFVVVNTTHASVYLKRGGPYNYPLMYGLRGCNMIDMPLSPLPDVKRAHTLLPHQIALLQQLYDVEINSLEKKLWPQWFRFGEEEVVVKTAIYSDVVIVGADAPGKGLKGGCVYTPTGFGRAQMMLMLVHCCPAPSNFVGHRATLIVTSSPSKWQGDVKKVMGLSETQDLRDPRGVVITTQMPCEDGAAWWRVILDDGDALYNDPTSGRLTRLGVEASRVRADRKWVLHQRHATVRSDAPLLLFPPEARNYEYDLEKLCFRAPPSGNVHVDIATVKIEDDAFASMYALYTRASEEVKRIVDPAIHSDFVNAMKATYNGGGTLRVGNARIARLLSAVVGSNGSEDECPVCYQVLCAQTEVKLRDCGHRLCRSCATTILDRGRAGDAGEEFGVLTVAGYVTTQASCPMCRAPFLVSDIVTSGPRRRFVDTEPLKPLEATLCKINAIVQKVCESVADGECVIVVTPNVEMRDALVARVRGVVAFATSQEEFDAQTTNAHVLITSQRVGIVAPSVTTVIEAAVEVGLSVEDVKTMAECYGVNRKVKLQRYRVTGGVEE